MKKLRVYLAAGWFNPEQKRQMNEVYDVLKELHTMGGIELFAPFYDGIVLTKDDPNLRQKMKEVWELDIARVRETDVIVACTQDHDVGTIFECGYGSCCGAAILCFNSKPELGLNVMLAQEARGFVKTQKDLRQALEAAIVHFDNNGNLRDWRWNLWEGEPI